MHNQTLHRDTKQFCYYCLQSLSTAQIIQITIKIMLDPLLLINLYVLMINLASLLIVYLI